MPGKAEELERLQSELRNAEERRAEEALKLYGEVIDERQSGCFWLVVSVALVLAGAAVWMLERPDGSVWAYAPVCLAAGCLLLSFLRLVRMRRADTVAEHAVAALDSKVSDLRETVEELGPGEATGEEAS